MADIPGVAFSGSPGVDRAKLKGADAKPSSSHGFLSWSTPTGEGSQSPASERSGRVGDDAKPPALLRAMWESLELPGEPADYHFSIQSCVGALWGQRTNDASLLSTIEELCLLDLQLVEAVPEAVSHVRDGATQYFNITAFSRLVQMYEREGALHEALSIAERAARFSQLEDKAEQLRGQVEALESEEP